MKKLEPAATLAINIVSEYKNCFKAQLKVLMQKMKPLAKLS
jgi:hypothetical protein